VAPATAAVAQLIQPGPGGGKRKKIRGGVCVCVCNMAELVVGLEIEWLQHYEWAFLVR
jgi:hypothetical protein